MKKNTLYAVLTAMALTFVGLSTIQVYWIRNSITIKEAQFAINVKSALTDITNYLERQEVNERMLRSGFDEQFCFYIDSAVCFIPPNELGSNATIEGDSMIIIEGYKNQIQTQFIQNFFDDLTHQRAQFMTDIFLDLFKQRNKTPIQYSIDLDELKPLIKEVLKSRGIVLDHNVAILSSQGAPLAMQSGLDESTFHGVINSKYRTPLFNKGIFNHGYRLHLDFPNERNQLLLAMWPMLLSSSFLMLLIIVVFAFTIYTIIKQKKLSIIKNDFIGNMTHELKTPISTISLACEALSNDSMVSNREAKDRFVGMIRDENKRLETLVESVLRTSLLEKGDQKYNFITLDIVQLLKQTCNNVEIRITDQEGELTKEFHESKIFVNADKTHLTNVFYNLFDNAIKYSPNAPKIKVSVSAANGIATVKIKDNGLGVSRENQSKIFDKLYRVPNGNTHDVKGFGLGLSYTKIVVEKHQGEICVKSKLGEGSTFTVKLPTINEQN